MMFSLPKQTSKQKSNTIQHICDTSNRKQCSEYNGMGQYVEHNKIMDLKAQMCGGVHTVTGSPDVSKEPLQALHD